MKSEMKRGDETQRINRNYYIYMYVNTLENLEAMDRFLGTYKLPKLSHEDIECLNG